MSDIKGQTMSDLIERDKAIEAIEDVTWYHQNRNKDMVSGANDDEHQAWYKADDIYKALESVPSARPKEGRWIEVTNGRGGHECSECHDYAPSFQNGAERLSHFCPNCGSDNREREGE